MKYQDEKFYWSYQRGVSWPDDYIGPEFNDPGDFREIGGSH